MDMFITILPEYTFVLSDPMVSMGLPSYTVFAFLLQFLVKVQNSTIHNINVFIIFITSSC